MDPDSMGKEGVCWEQEAHLWVKQASCISTPPCRMKGGNR